MNPSFRITAKAKDKVGEIYLYGQIGASFLSEGITAQSFINSVKELKEKGVTSLTLYINSLGGNVFEGTAIYNAFQRFEGKKTIVVDGLCASIASVIAMGADTIRMGEGSLMMIHEPSGIAFGRIKDMENTKERLEKIRDSMADLYSRRTGRAVDDVKAIMAKETWMTAKEAVKEKFADETVQLEEKEEDKEMKSVAFDSALWQSFRHPPIEFFAMVQPPVPERREPPPPAIEEKKMDLVAVARALGLSADANESAIFASITSLRAMASTAGADLASMLSITGKENVAEARGVILAWKSSHDQVGPVMKENAELKAAQTSTKVTAMVEAAVQDGRIPPAMKDFWMGEGNKNFATLETYLAAAPKVVPGPQEGVNPKPVDPAAARGSVVAISEHEQEGIFKTLGIIDPEAKKKVVASVQAQNTWIAKNGGHIPTGLTH